MKQTQKLTCLVTALMAISHDRIDYPAGSIFDAPEEDVVFLKLAKCVRVPTDDELKAYEERQTLAQVEAPTSKQPDVPQAPIDTEPETVEIVNPYHGWLKSDLNNELDKRGIERNVTRNDELAALLMADDKQADA